jgi:hypothetical protein
MSALPNESILRLLYSISTWGWNGRKCYFYLGLSQLYNAWSQISIWPQHVLHICKDLNIYIWVKYLGAATISTSASTCLCSWSVSLFMKINIWQHTQLFISHEHVIQRVLSQFHQPMVKHMYIKLSAMLLPQWLNWTVKVLPVAVPSTDPMLTWTFQCY